MLMHFRLHKVSTLQHLHGCILTHAQSKGGCVEGRSSIVLLLALELCDY